MKHQSAGRSVATRNWVPMIALALSFGCSDSGDEASTNGLGATTGSGGVNDTPSSGVMSSTGAPAVGAAATASATGGAGMGAPATASTTGGMGAAATASTSTGGAGMGAPTTDATGGAGMGGAAGTAAGGAPAGGGTGGGAVVAETGGVGGAGGDAQAGDGSGGTPDGSAGMGGSGGSSAGNMSPGCGSADPLTSGNFTENIAGTMRNYTVDVPANYDTNKPYRLIFVWHPLDGSAGQVAGSGYNGLKSLASDSAIFVAPDGLNGSNDEASGRGWWNVNGVDMQLFTAMFDNLNNGLCIDQDRIFSTGFSFGGMMSYTVGYQFDVFRAIAPCSGDLQVIPREENNTAPLPMMAFHGDNDNFVTTARGRAARDKYLVRNGCGTQTQPVDPSPCVQYQDCEVPTFWCEFPGAHTTWNQQPQAIWRFFSQF